MAEPGRKIQGPKRILDFLGVTHKKYLDLGQMVPTTPEELEYLSKKRNSKRGTKILPTALVTIPEEKGEGSILDAVEPPSPTVSIVSSVLSPTSSVQTSEGAPTTLGSIRRRARPAPSIDLNDVRRAEISYPGVLSDPSQATIMSRSGSLTPDAVGMVPPPGPIRFGRRRAPGRPGAPEAWAYNFVKAEIAPNSAQSFEGAELAVLHPANVKIPAYPNFELYLKQRQAAGTLNADDRQSYLNAVRGTPVFQKLQKALQAGRQLLLILPVGPTFEQAPEGEGFNLADWNELMRAGIARTEWYHWLMAELLNAR